ncbi:MAG: 4-hydroxy-tetrahydrodipicolinate synthase [Prolixibacteraceae bacterium]|nr:4-hydroxy-tetrahydrodipicolinate synthase [Prolixibacteraceae bacterium]HQJ85573.1 4-hydroxy-tetrahydrodipicolinate synthase [Prolixibacteraceae bacterium]
MSFDFTGAGVALVTPFKNDGSVDFDALGQIVENQIEGGMDYMVIMGTTSETPTLNYLEKREISAFVREKNHGRLPLITGLGGYDTLDTVKKLESADLNGIDGILAITPYYNRPNQEGLFRHFREMSRHSRVPLILYNVPSRTGTNMEADTVIRLAECCENIVAVKEASGNITQISRIIRHAPPHFNVLSGDDIYALPIISVGGKGVISVIANAFPKKLSTLVHAALEGRLADATRQHLELTELMKLQFEDGNPAGIKFILSHTGTIQNVLRLPLVPANAAVAEKIAAELQNLQ